LDVVETDPVYEAVLQLEETEAFTPNFEDMGYESMYSLKNMGLVYIFAIMCPISLLFGFIASKLPLKYGPLIYEKIFNFYVWSATVGFLNGSYLLLAVCAAVNTKHWKYDDYGSLANDFFVLQCVFMTIVLPFFVFVAYWRWLRDHEYDESSVSGYDGDSESGEREVSMLRKYWDQFVGTYLESFGLKPELLWFSGIILARKLLLCVTCVYLQYYDNFSLFSFVFCSVAMIIATGLLMPYDDNFLNFVHIFNECFVLIQIYHLFTFTDLVIDVQTRHYLGYSAIFFQCINLIFNFSLVAIATCKDAYSCLLKKW